MTRAAFIMLAHENLAEAGAFAHVLAAGGRPVAVHIDARASADAVAAFDAATAGDDIVRLRRRRCAWGMFSLVEATLDGLSALAGREDIGHIALVSGADLPLRPLAAFDAYLAARPDTDLIEAVELSEKRWVTDGLTEERFRLYHPFDWRRRRRLFDLCVDWQRRLGVRRQLPKGLTPALGSQWWALSRRTAAAILADPQLPVLKRFFRWVWIPDESFFQTLARRHGAARVDLSPTLARFDEGGRPYVFHDDHADLLGRSDHFFARKIHRRAAGLRADRLARALGPADGAVFTGAAPEDAFVAARRSRTHGREHLISPARVRRLRRGESHATPAPYTVIGGVSGRVAEAVSKELTRRGDLTCHGRLFAPGAVRLHGGAALAAGGTPATAWVRDFWPDQFLINLARGAAIGGGAVAFCLPPEDRYAIGGFVAADPGARILWYRGAWALDLFARRADLSGDDIAELAREAAAAERGVLAEFRKAGAALTLRSAAMLIDDPEAATAEMLAVANARASRRAMKPPVYAPPGWGRARPFLRALQKAGAEVEAGLIAPGAGPGPGPGPGPDGAPDPAADPDPDAVRDDPARAPLGRAEGAPAQAGSSASPDAA